MTLRALGIVSLLALGSVIGPVAHALPPLPQYAVLDEEKVLPEGIRATLERLLTEHDHVSDEQIVLAIFDSTGSEVSDAFARMVFDEWKVGDRGKDNGVLLVLFSKTKRAAMMAGSGQDDALGDAIRKQILEEKVLPELKRGDFGRAASLGILEILRSVHSPLITDGKAERALRAGGFAGAFSAREWINEPTVRGGWVLFLIGILVLALAAYFVTAAEAHFTSGGWFRPSPWRWARWKFEVWNPKRTREKLGGAHGDW
jgi:uncharacterized membrane protein YgcG